MTEEIYSPGLEGVIAGETAISTIAGGSLPRLLDRRPGRARHVRRSRLLAAARRTAQRRSSSPASASRLAESAAGAEADHRRRSPDSDRAAPMMDVMRTGASLLAHWDPDVGDNSHEANLRKAERLLAQLPVVMAARHRLEAGQRAGRRRSRSLAGRQLFAHAVSRRPTPRRTSRRWTSR